MVADTYDPVLGLILQGTGNNNNSWGTSLNNSMIRLAARATAGLAVRGITGGSLDLTVGSPPASVATSTGPNPALDHIQYFNGTLSSTQTVIVPPIARSWLFVNATSGAFQLLVKTPAGGSPANIPQSTAKWLWCDGTNVIRQDNDEIGTLVHSGYNGIPPGVLYCSGTSLLRTDYPDLFARIGTQWGAVDSTHFTLPDFVTSNRFLRQAGGGLAWGTVQGSTNISHTHNVQGNSGSTDRDLNHTHAQQGTFGSGNSLQSLNHTHSFTVPNTNNAGGPILVAGGGSFAISTFNGTTGAADLTGHQHNTTISGQTAFMDRSIDHLHFINLNTGGGTADASEARPNNTAIYIGIKY